MASRAQPKVRTRGKAARGHMQLGRYRLKHQIGKGSRGVVWLGYDPVLDRPVAIKQVRHRGSRTSIRETRERMIREARSLGRLTHSNVVGIHDAGADESGDMTYLVMEFVPSPPLDMWIKSRRPEVDQIVEVFREAGRGLAAAHDLGIVHRDVKPGNLLVAKDRSVKVVDFGLALDRGQDPKKRVTQVGTSVGTPNYMSPEVMLGYEADHRSDQYSFCVAFYEALYGRRPVRRRTVKELREAVIRGNLEAPPPRKDVPASVRALIERGLSRLPDERFDSMDELVSVLDEVMLPHPPRRWLPAAAAAVVAAAVAAVAVLSLV